MSYHYHFKPMLWLAGTLLVAWLTQGIAAGDAADNAATLPGLLFTPNFKSYSGYLSANARNTWRMFYWLSESRSDPDNDPLLVWFNGGPGCSSFGGIFEELGPFYVTKDGKNLYENVHSWNQRANLLALESPIGVGFSYDTEDANFIRANDDQTAEQNYLALKDFFLNVQPKYKNRTFFLAGESYAGIYIPMLAKLLTERINNGDFPNPNFQGAAIGNGYMNVQYLTNSLVLWSVYHGKISIQDWELMKAECSNGVNDADRMDFMPFLRSINRIDYVSDNSLCGNLTQKAIFLDYNMDQYNFYQDCYDDTYGVLDTKKKQHPRTTIKRKEAVRRKREVNPTALIWENSTDNQYGYPCWSDPVLSNIYMNRPEVYKALHIDPEWIARNQSWADCSNPMYDAYVATYQTTNEFFRYTLNNTKNPTFRFLIYNGDVDTVCNFLGDSWFIRDVAAENQFTALPRVEWFFRKQTAGYIGRYTRGEQSIDVLTVKGAGHFVPNDRPGPSAQMITNFMFPDDEIVDYSSSHLVDPVPVPLPFTAANEDSPNVSPSMTWSSSLCSVQLILIGFLLMLQ